MLLVSQWWAAPLFGRILSRQPIWLSSTCKLSPSRTKRIIIIVDLWFLIGFSRLERSVIETRWCGANAISLILASLSKWWKSYSTCIIPMNSWGYPRRKMGVCLLLPNHFVWTSQAIWAKAAESPSQPYLTTDGSSSLDNLSEDQVQYRSDSDQPSATDRLRL